MYKSQFWKMYPMTGFVVQGHISFVYCCSSRDIVEIETFSKIEMQCLAVLAS